MHPLCVALTAIHIFAFTLAAPSPNPLLSLPALSLIGDPSPQTSSPSNLTLPKGLNLPPDPDYYAIPSSDEQLKFWSYGTSIRKTSADYVIQSAKRDAAVNIKQRSKLDVSTLHYQYGKVHLLLHLTIGATWEVVDTMVGGLESWFTKWAFVECDFNMGQIGLENMFGTGALVQFDEGVE